MFDEINTHIYNIALPSSAVINVMEWFELMESKGELANALIELVYEKIKAEKPLENSFVSFNSQSKLPQTLTTPTINQRDLFDSLYDWQGSSNATFKEEKVEAKVKKKMLSV